MQFKDLLELKWFTPLKATVFNSLAQEIKARPVIIIHDTENDHYYYIKARDARLRNGELKERFKSEILIPKSGEPNTLFIKDSYLDCSQIFYIRDSELEELVKKYQKTEILDSKELEFDQVEEIFGKIHECLTSKPPYMAISRVSYDSKTKITKSEVEYASDEHLDRDYKTIKIKTKEIDELKDKLTIDKDQTSLDLFETILSDAWREYRQEKVYNHLFKWINENEFVQKGLNSMQIIQEYDKLLNPIIPEVINGRTIHFCLSNNKWRKNDDFSLSKKLEETDFKFMINWFGKNQLKINMESFNQFCNAMKKERPQSDAFDFLELEFQFKREISKLEK
ncbi:Mbov_0400 family ICE element protein [Mesomycoplasma ovipneumoniae]